MRTNFRATRVLLAASLVLGPAAATTVLTAGSAHAAGSIPWVCETALPSQAITTIDLIAAGGPYPYSKDGEVFYNNEALLPAESTGYYHAYTVKTPGVSTRGARRIITAEDGEEYYTPDHYASFSDIDFTC
ncbi:ribonuclease T1 [Streptomyces sp. 846.5]|nr:ribonuclease domain-containing protein [Streptomyces sp. 846.5]TDU02577.1 ribonuclease T1 [Streptomyces sp. 846.5]